MSEMRRGEVVLRRSYTWKQFPATVSGNNVSSSSI